MLCFHAIISTPVLCWQESKQVPSEPIKRCDLYKQSHCHNGRQLSAPFIILLFSFHLSPSSYLKVQLSLLLSYYYREIHIHSTNIHHDIKHRLSELHSADQGYNARGRPCSSHRPCSFHAIQTQPALALFTSHKLWPPLLSGTNSNRPCSLTQSQTALALWRAPYYFNSFRETRWLDRPCSQVWATLFPLLHQCFFVFGTKVCSWPPLLSSYVAYFSFYFASLFITALALVSWLIFWQKFVYDRPCSCMLKRISKHHKSSLSSEQAPTINLIHRLSLFPF